MQKPLSLEPAWSPDESATVRTRSSRPPAPALDGASTLSALAAGLAHEVNNPLAYVLTNLDYVREQLSHGCDEDLQAALEEARLGALRIGSVVRSLQIVAASEGAKSGEVDLGEVAEAACALVQYEGQGSQVVALRSRSPRVLTNRSQAGYLVLRVVTFASRASKRGPNTSLVVSTHVDPAGRASIDLSNVTSGDHVEELESEATAYGLVSAAAALSAEIDFMSSGGTTNMRLTFPASQVVATPKMPAR